MQTIKTKQDYKYVLTTLQSWVCYLTY